MSDLAPIPASPDEGPDMQPVVAFLDGGGFANAVRSCRFTQQELIERIIGHARSEDPRVSQKGIDQFRQWLHDTLSLNGHMVHEAVTEKLDAQGTQASISRTRLAPPRPPKPQATPHRSLPAIRPPDPGDGPVAPDRHADE